MKLIKYFLSVLLILPTLLIQAQVEVFPLGSNPALQQSEKTTRAYIQNPSFAYAAKMDTADLLVIYTGESVELCVDVSELNGTFDSLSNIGCPISEGILDNEFEGDACFRYTANEGVEYGLDTVCFEACTTDGICDTFLFPIQVQRPTIEIEVADVFLSKNEFTQICVPTGDLVGAFSHMSFADCQDDDLGTMTISGNCIDYQASNMEGVDQICLEICDEFGICDIAYFTVSISRQLPFFDDFSSESMQLDDKNWADDFAYQNRSFGFEPISVGVATFDGLDAEGQPYVGQTYADFLSSTPLDLSNTAGNVYVSFFIQNKGIGLQSEAGDSLILEFRNSNGDWIWIDAYDGTDVPLVPNESPAFEFKSYQVPASYLFNGFQFRLKNIATQKGLADIWNIDYVRVDDQIVPSQFIDQVYFTQPLKPILWRYSAMPLWQFINNVHELRQDFPVTVLNHNNPNTTNGESFGDPTKYAFSELETGTFILEKPWLNSVNILPKQPLDYLVSLTSSEFVAFQNTIYAIPDGGLEQFTFQQLAYFNVDGNIDSLYHNTIIKDYFAYDDGTAEMGFAQSSLENEAAVQFVNNLEDSLRAINIQFATSNGTVPANTLVQLKVWLDINDDPIYEKVVTVENQESINGFYTHFLEDEDGLFQPMLLPADTFYVGWQPVQTDVPVGVGFDMNTPEAADYIYIKKTFPVEWVRLSDATDVLLGALMIRPIFGDVEPTTDIPTIIEEQQALVVYPNPSRDRIYFENEAITQVQIFDFSGKHLGIFNVNQLSMDISFLNNGIFLMNAFDKNGQFIGSSKIIKK